MRLWAHLTVALCLVPRLELELDEADPLAESAAPIIYTMPLNVWDRKFYRTSFMEGMEALLVQRMQGSKWLVLKAQTLQLAPLAQH